MRPDASPNPAVESVKELADMGSLVIIPPPPQDRVQLGNQLLGLQRYTPSGARTHLVHETSNRFLARIRVKRSRFCTATNLVRRKPQPSPALDFVAEKLESVLDVHDSRLARMQLHAQSFQDFTGCSHRCPRLCRQFAGNHPVVGPACELISLASHLPVQRRQENVTEQGRDYAPYTKGNFGQLGSRRANSEPVGRHWAGASTQSECCVG